MRLAAKHAATWVTVDGRGSGREQLERLEGVCAEVGRDFESLDKLELKGFLNNPLGSFAEFEDTAGRCAEAGFTDLVVHWPREREPFTGRRDVLERVAAEVLGAETVEAG